MATVGIKGYPTWHIKSFSENTYVFAVLNDDPTNSVKAVKEGSTGYSSSGSSSSCLVKHISQCF